VTGSQDHIPQHGEDPVADALGWARAAGMYVVVPEDSVTVSVICPGCRIELWLPAEPSWPRLAARRIRSFAAWHHRHGGNGR
jgi:hypothetical protein